MFLDVGVDPFQDTVIEAAQESSPCLFTQSGLDDDEVATGVEATKIHQPLILDHRVACLEQAARRQVVVQAVASVQRDDDIASQPCGVSVGSAATRQCEHHEHHNQSRERDEGEWPQHAVHGVRRRGGAVEQVRSRRRPIDEPTDRERERRKISFDRPPFGRCAAIAVSRSRRRG